MNDLTLYDIMGSQHYVVCHREDDGRITTNVIDDNDEVVFDETSHPFAWESLVSFARMVMKQDKKLHKDEQ